jgi:DNA gyrase subunit A
MVCVDRPDRDILVVSEKGYGKRSALEDYRITNRGGKGVKTMNLTDKTGSLASILAVDDDLDFMIINKSGITIRLKVDELRVMGRNTQGVRLINLRGNDEIAAICTVIKSDDDEDVEGENVASVVSDDSVELTDNEPAEDDENTEAPTEE